MQNNPHQLTPTITIEPTSDYILVAKCPHDYNSVLKEKGFYWNPIRRLFQRRIRGEYIQHLIQSLQAFKGRFHIYIDQEV